MKLSSHHKISHRSRSSKMQCDLSKWLLATSPLSRTISHGMDMLISMEWPQLLCKPSLIPPCRLGIQKLHIHWKCLLDLEFIQTRSATCQPLSTDSEATGRPRQCCLPWRHRRVTWITWPPLWRSFQLPNSEIFISPEQFFIATASVVKDAVNTPDCQGLREQWYYLRFYVRRTMPPT